MASRWCWVADGGVVLLGNGSASFHGSVVLLGNGIPGFYGGPVLSGNFIVKGSLEETSEVRTVQRRCEWIVKLITYYDVNWIVKSITCDVNWIAKAITYDVN